MADLTLVGRSSSHFSRTARMFALELGAPHTFRPVLDLTSLDRAAYADKLGSERLATLKPGSAPSGSVDYGEYR